MDIYLPNNAKVNFIKKTSPKMQREISGKIVTENINILFLVKQIKLSFMIIYSCVHTVYGNYTFSSVMKLPQKSYK